MKKNEVSVVCPKVKLLLGFSSSGLELDKTLHTKMLHVTKVIIAYIIY